MATKTVDEAMALLRKYRSQHIANGRRIADELIAKNGTATTKDVYAEMEKRGLIDFSIGQHWLGAVFRGGKYTWTGLTVQGHGHDRLAKVWRAA